MKPSITVNGQDISEFGADLRVPAFSAMEDFKTGAAWIAAIAGGWPAGRQITIIFKQADGSVVTREFEAMVRRADGNKIEIEPLELDLDMITISFPDEEAATAFLAGLKP